MSNPSTPRILTGVAIAAVVAIGFAAAAGAFTPAQTVAPVAPAAATSPVGLPVAGSTPPAAGLPSSAQLAAAGIHDPIKIERDDRRIEVEHRDAAGRRFETDLDARTGAVVRHEQESSDDGYRGGRDDD